jgi:hypothetical protein
MNSPTATASRPPGKRPLPAGPSPGRRAAAATCAHPKPPSRGAPEGSVDRLASRAIGRGPATRGRQAARTRMPPKCIAKNLSSRIGSPPSLPARRRPVESMSPVQGVASAVALAGPARVGGDGCGRLACGDRAGAFCARPDAPFRAPLRWQKGASDAPLAGRHPWRTGRNGLNLRGNSRLTGVIAGPVLAADDRSGLGRRRTALAGRRDESP